MQASNVDIDYNRRFPIIRGTRVLREYYECDDHYTACDTPYIDNRENYEFVIPRLGRLPGRVTRFPSPTQTLIGRIQED